MSDKDLRTAWISNFSDWQSNPEAESICRLICTVIALRARTSSLHGSDNQKVRHICFSIGIPQEEYELVSKGCLDA
jgi:hypothetical protein